MRYSRKPPTVPVGKGVALTLETFKKETAAARVRPCVLQKFMTGISAHDRAAIIEAIGNDDITVSAIQRVITGLGWSHNQQVIERHRLDGCRSCVMKGKR